MLQHRGLCLPLNSRSFYGVAPVPEIIGIIDEAHFHGYGFLWLWPDESDRAPRAAADLRQRCADMAVHASRLGMGIGLVCATPAESCVDPRQVFPQDTPLQAFAQIPRAWANRSAPERDVGAETYYASLQASADALQRSHPGCQAFAWMSDADEQWSSEMASILADEAPEWAAGVVTGNIAPPGFWETINLPEGYARLAMLDLSVSHGAGTCGANPFPVRLSQTIQSIANAGATGLICHSGGIHDDINRAVAVELARSAEQPVADVLRDYAFRYFAVEGKDADRFADIVLACEDQFATVGGSALEQCRPDPTEAARLLASAASLEREIGSKVVREHWRWQSLKARLRIADLTCRVSSAAELKERVIGALLPILESAGPISLAKGAGEARAAISEARDMLAQLEEVLSELARNVYGLSAEDGATVCPAERVLGDALGGGHEEYLKTIGRLNEVVRKIEACTDHEAARAVVASARANIDRM